MVFFRRVGRSGGWFEGVVARYFRRRGYRVLGRNNRVCGVEIDLVLFREHFVFVEVKSLSRVENIDFRLSYGQTRRLLRARQCYQDRHDCLVELVVVFVLPDSECVVVPIDELHSL